jgi:hypothetical protein
MRHPPFTRLARLAALCSVAAALAISSCSHKLGHIVIPNMLPTVTITSAPIDTNVVCDPSPTRSCYLITVDWVGYDPDGRVDHYLYAVDPPTDAGLDTVWKFTRASEVRETFIASRPIEATDASGRHIFEAPHVFVLKAVDNTGASGPVVNRAFFSFTEAPSVQIIDPVPVPQITPLFPPSIRFTWSGTDPDGVFHTKPVLYKYIMLGPGTAPMTPAFVTAHPDSLRRFYAPDFPGWFSVGGDTTTLQFTNLTPGQTFAFAIIGIDEAGAYSPVIAPLQNLYVFRVGFAGSNGPKIHLFNEFFDYRYRFGGYCSCPLAEIPIEVPANIKITFNWEADPPPGADIRSYRWSLDNPDVSVEDPRQDESDPNQFFHWSTRSLGTTSCTVGPFPGGTSHRLYVEAEDNNGLRSLGIVNFLPIQSSLERRLLIVNDCRFKGDNILPNATCIRNPLGPWPTAAELDTFFHATGGKPWNCYPGWQTANPTLTTPGLFSAYGGAFGGAGSFDIPNVNGYDTLSTRTGKSDLTVRLSTLGKYSHVVWIVDGTAANYGRAGTDPVQPQTALRYMTAPSRFNSIGAYIKQGGRVWMVGGGCGFASTIEWNSAGNDRPTTTFSSFPPGSELRPGRFMYDVIGWRSEFRASVEPVEIVRYTGRFGDSASVTGAGSPYATLPPMMEKKTFSSDPLPPNRQSSSDFYQDVTAMEYLQIENFLIQQVPVGQDVFEDQSVLDTLYRAPYGGGLPSYVENHHNVVMSYFHPPSIPQGVFFTGFNLWYFRRAENKSLVDFVLQNMWHLAPNAVASRVQQRAEAIPVDRTRARATPGIWDRLRALGASLTAPSSTAPKRSRP